MVETRRLCRFVPLLVLATGCGMEASSPAETPPGATASARCSNGYTSCSGACVNLRSNAANCGACGHACAAGQVCQRGTCSGCPSGATACNGTCVNLLTSASNCGSCGNACPSGETCSSGACACPNPSTVCGTACVNLLTSASNCGSCGNACASGATCSAGACACPGAETVCDSACVDTTTSAANCGACDNACPSGDTCSAGSCICPAGSAVCGTDCVSLATSQNCGGCGIACASGQVCAGGTCVTGLAVGAHTYKNDVAGRGTNPMTTAAIATQATGSTFVVFAGAGISGADAFLSLGDNQGNTYTQVGTAQPYATNQGELRAFVCNQPCQGGSGHTFSLYKTSSLAKWETVLFVVEVLGAPTLDTFAQANLSTLSAGLTATTSRAGDMLLVCALAASYGSPDRYTPSAGFTLLDDQTNGSNSLGGADAWELAGAPGAYTGTLTSSLASSGAIFLLALSPP